MAFLDSDDLWLPRRIELQLEQLAEHPDCGWSCTGYGIIDAHGRPIPGRPAVPYRPQSGWVAHRGGGREGAGVLRDRMLVGRHSPIADAQPGVKLSATGRAVPIADTPRA